MTKLETYLKNKICKTISDWNENDIYAISFFVYANEDYEYNGYTNVSEFHISYNTESDCEGEDQLSEERWNYAFWRQNETPLIEVDGDKAGIELLFDWYKENEIENIGFEDDDCYDEDMQYIGKGPVGQYELVSLIADIAKDLQQSGFIKDKFGKPIPIIIHDLEYPWYMIEATKNANPNSEADVFFEAMKELGFIE